MAVSKERRVMLAMDGSSYADYAFDSLGIGSADIVSGMIEDEKRHSEQYLEKLKEMMQAKGLHGKIKQVHGRPRVEILRVAEEENIEFLITGTRGMGQVRRTLLGSVSDHVLHHSHVPVLICRHEDDHHHRHQHHGHHLKNK